MQCLQNIDVLEHDVVCKSDHFPIKFKININIRRKRATKRKCYNFKRANWDALNADLCHTNWNSILNCTEPEYAWVKFKARLSELVNKHVPTINCKSEFNPLGLILIFMISVGKRSVYDQSLKNPDVTSMD